VQFNVQCGRFKWNKLFLPYNVFLEVIVGGFGHHGHPLATPLIWSNITALCSTKQNP